MNSKALLCNYLGGSHAYGLNTATSDKDYRGVFLSKDIGQILDPYQYIVSGAKCENAITEECDVSYHELRHFLHILRQANTNAVELLFNQNWEETTPEWKHIQDNRHSLLDPEKLYSALKGYIISETKLAIGERTGKLGSKRFAQLEKYGFSPKNFVQLFRLCIAGRWFFITGEFLVNIGTLPFDLAILMNIKQHPERYTKDQLLELLDTYKAKLDVAYSGNIERTKLIYSWKDEVATQIILDCYYPIIKAAVPKRKWFLPWR